MGGLNYKQFQDEVLQLLNKHGKDIVCFVFGVAYMDADDALHVEGCSLVPLPPRDREEHLLRDDCAKKASELVMRLTENTFLGRMGDE